MNDIKIIVIIIIIILSIHILVLIKTKKLLLFVKAFSTMIISELCLSGKTYWLGKFVGFSNTHLYLSPPGNYIHTYHKVVDVLYVWNMNTVICY